MKFAAIGPISVHFPDRLETNDDLQAENPDWNMELIYSKTGIWSRYVAAEKECASDLGVSAAKKLFQEHDVDPGSIDFLLLCTQTPDYPLPTTACLMQHRLGLPTSAGSLDFNLGCSGYVYGLSLADGLIRSGVARRVLLITAETYSKYIAPSDRSLRTIFSDAAAATLVEASDEPTLSGFVFGTDGSGGDMLIVNKGGARPESDAIQPRGRRRWPSCLYMDGPGIINFTVDALPRLVDKVMRTAQWSADETDYYLLHQATRKLLELLRERLELPEDRLPIELKDVGNTVSCTLPILIDQMRRDGRLTRDKKSLLVGFGVGLSWAGCAWRETLAPRS